MDHWKVSMNTLLDYPSLADHRLVELHLGGDHDAFRQIVERHQAMVCALAYCACGDVARSEDVAQKVFIAAWQQLPQLREPAKLRGWLGGITRNLAHDALRRAARTPTSRADELSPDTAADAAGPREHTIGADEAALMWSALEGLPATYREPMVLFYREGRSAAAVAAALEISEDTARQRLARGRTMLTERMAKLVEETLERSAPTPAFAGMVILALPVGPFAVEATLGAGGAASKAVTMATAAGGVVAKGGVAIKVLGAVAALPVLLNGLTEYLRFRAHFEAQPSGGRGEIVRLHLRPLLINAAVFSGLAFILWSPFPGIWKSFAMVPLAVVLVVAAGFDNRRRLNAVERERGKPVFEYRSAGGMWGLPWVHIRSGGCFRGAKASGWIAISDGLAIGGLFAGAPIGVAPISVGGIAIAIFALGGVAVGQAAVGCFAGGYWAAGGLALAAHAAEGALVIARDFAVGKNAIALHANDAAARAFIDTHPFFQLTRNFWRVIIWAAFFGWLPQLVLMGWHLRQTRPAR